MSAQKPEARSQEPEEWREIPAEAFENDELREGIAERLERLQQAPHAHLANLRGIQEDNGKKFLAWQKVEGRPLSDIVEKLSEDDLYRILRELIDVVEGLHQLGLVHGNLNGRSVIVAHDGVYLTDASALLWTDEQIDVRAVEEMIRTMLKGRGLPGPAEELKSLRSLAAFLDGGYVPEFTDAANAETRVDFRMLLWAIVLILLGIAVAAMLTRYMRSPADKMLQSRGIVTLNHRIIESLKML